MIMIRRHLTSKQREALWQSEAEKACDAGRGEHPICNICHFPIIRGREWDASHDPSKARWLGGEVTGIAHRKCNRDQGAKIENPKFAKSERVRKRFLDLTRSHSPLPGGRDDDLKKTMRGEVVVRASGLPPYPREHNDRASKLSSRAAPAARMGIVRSNYRCRDDL